MNFYLYLFSKNGLCGPGNEFLVISRQNYSKKRALAKWGKERRGITDVRKTILEPAFPGEGDCLPMDRILEEML